MNSRSNGWTLIFGCAIALIPNTCNITFYHNVSSQVKDKGAVNINMRVVFLLASNSILTMELDAG